MKKIILTLFLLLSTSLFADRFYIQEVNEPFEQYYPKLKKAIETNHMHILYELDLMKKFSDSRFKKKFGKNFNINNVEKSMTLLLCNGYIGNQVLNIDPSMMALCPIKLTVIKSGNKTKVVFLKFEETSENKRVKNLMLQLDDVLIHTIGLTVDKYMEKSTRASYSDIYQTDDY